MGVGGISIWQLLIILVIVILLFGTKRLKNIGSDLGEAIRGFRNSMSSPNKEDEDRAREGAAITQSSEMHPGEASPQARTSDTATTRNRA